MEKELLKILNDGRGMNFSAGDDEAVQKLSSVDKVPGTFCDSSTITQDEPIAIQKALELSPTELVRHSCACCASITSTATIASDAQPTMSTPLDKSVCAPAKFDITANHENDKPEQGERLIKHDSLQTFYTVQLSVIRLQKFFRGYLVRSYFACTNIM